MEKTIKNLMLWVLTINVFAGCSTPSPYDNRSRLDFTHLSDATPRHEPPSRYGNPQFYEVLGKRYYVSDTSEGYRERGIASWYGEDFHGKRTSSGPPYDMYAMTAAHKSLPIPTYVRVTHQGNGRSIVVKVNDRGPFVDDRIIDLSYAAAAKLDIIDSGTAEVEVTALPPYQYLSGFGQGHQKNIPFYLQVGAFSDRRNAEQLQYQLASRLNHAIRIDSSSDNLHKVHIGPLSSAAEAEQLTPQLAPFGIERPQVIYD